MAKVETAGSTDGGLTKMGTYTLMSICAGQPTSFGDIATRTLASVALAGGDYTLAAGDVSGRKSTVGAKTGISITASGTADHVAISDGTNYIVTTCTSQALTSGGTVATSTWKKEIAAPT